VDQLFEALRPIVCDQAVACGQPTSVRYWLNDENRPDNDQVAIWGSLCASATLCVQNPAECRDDEGLSDLAGGAGLCAEDVTGCFQAIAAALGCAWDETNGEQLDANPPPECARLVAAQEQAERESDQVEYENDDQVDQMPGAGGRSAGG
jgi:hypothetical protein